MYSFVFNFFFLPTITVVRLSVILYEAFHHYIVFHCANIPQLIYSIVNRQWLFISQGHYNSAIRNISAHAY